MLRRWSLILSLLTLLQSSPIRTKAEPQVPAFEKKLSPVETQEVLTFLSKKLSANLDAIKTWQGTYHCVDRHYFDIKSRKQTGTDSAGDQRIGDCRKSEGKFQF